MINFLSFTPEIQQLTRLGDTGFFENQPWIDYSTLGIRPEHITELITILSEIDEFNDLPETDPIQWTPVHAWRALAQMRAVEVLPTLMSLLERIDQEDDETVQVEMPLVFGLIGPPAIPGLSSYLANPANGAWARLAAAEGLVQIALLNPAYRSEVIGLLTGALANYLENRAMYNGLLVDFLSRLKAVESAGMVEQAYRAGRVDEDTAGDWEDFQVKVGLLEQRTTTPVLNRAAPVSFQDGVIDLPRKEQARPQEEGKKHNKKNRPRKEPKLKKATKKSPAVHKKKQNKKRG